MWPGNTNDNSILPEVKDGLRGWRLGRVVTVVDRGFSSDANLDCLRRAGGHWIAGERTRDDSADAQAVLARPGRYRNVGDNLRVKEVRLGGDESGKRWIICHNPFEAERDIAQRAAAIARVTEELDRIDAARVITGISFRLWIIRRSPATGSHPKCYYAWAMASITVDDAPKRLRKGAGQCLQPVALLARLGVHLAHDRRGLGAALLTDVILRVSELGAGIGCRGLLIHAETCSSNHPPIHSTWSSS